MKEDGRGDRLKSLLFVFLPGGAGIRAGNPPAVRAEEGEQAVIAKVIRHSIEWALTKDVEFQRSTMLRMKICSPSGSARIS